MSLSTDTSKHIGFLTKPVFGSDPELFIATNGKIIGAEKVIPKGGVGYTPNGRQIVLDGVQVELHPTPKNCRALMGNEFKQIMTKLYSTLQAKGAEVSFDTVVKLDKDELKSLSAAARQLGCAPSSNLHDPTATVKVSKTFRERSAGGHIHTDLSSTVYPGHPTAAQIITLVNLYDAFLGLPSVLIDRDPAQARRRKVYGRASEHRVKSYGFEYRVLSNFWLRSYPLMSFVFGMARLACNVFAATQARTAHYRNLNAPWDAPAELFKRLDLKKVAEAINKNDTTLAAPLWAIVEEFIDEFCIDQTSGLSTGDPIVNFRHFTNMIGKNGIGYWFPNDPIDHWVNMLEGHALNDEGFAGWETFLAAAVADDRADKAVDEFLLKLEAA